jgi:hypothetical protein
MASLNPPVALTAQADMDVELSVDRLARNLHLELLSNVGFVEWAAAIGADIGQRCLVNLVNLFGSRGLAVGFGAVVFPRLAAWLARVGLGLALGEGSGLALAGAGYLVELTAEAFVLGLEVVNPSLKRLAVSTPNRFHTGIIHSIGTCSCTDGRWEIAQFEVEALIKYFLGKPK